MLLGIHLPRWYALAVKFFTQCVLCNVSDRVSGNECMSPIYHHITRPHHRDQQSWKTKNCFAIILKMRNYVFKCLSIFLLIIKLMCSDLLNVPNAIQPWLQMKKNLHQKEMFRWKSYIRWNFEFLQSKYMLQFWFFYWDICGPNTLLESRGQREVWFYKKCTLFFFLLFFYNIF